MVVNFFSNDSNKPMLHTDDTAKAKLADMNHG